MRTTQQRSERYEQERVDASQRHKRKLEQQMLESPDHEEQESQDQLEEAASTGLPVPTALPDPESTRL